MSSARRWATVVKFCGLDVYVEIEKEPDDEPYVAEASIAGQVVDAESVGINTRSGFQSLQDYILERAS